MQRLEDLEYKYHPSHNYAEIESESSPKISIFYSKNFVLMNCRMFTS